MWLKTTVLRIKFDSFKFEYIVKKLNCWEMLILSQNTKIGLFGVHTMNEFNEVTEKN